MKRKSLAMFLSMLLAAPALAQQAPAPEVAGDRPPPPEQREGPGRDGPGRNGPGRDGPGGRPGGPGMMPGMMGAGGGMSDPRIAKFEMLRHYLDVVEGISRMTRDPSSAGIAAVVSASDILRPRGADTAIDYFTKLLPEVKSAAVQRAIRIQLVDFYKAAGQQDKAMEQLRALMVAEPSGGDVASPPR